MDGVKFTDSTGKNINVSVIGYFSIPDLRKDFIIYGIVDDNPSNENGNVLLGEIIKHENGIQILGILPEEKDLVVAYYNEISNQIGGDD